MSLSSFFSGLFRRKNKDDDDPYTMNGYTRIGGDPLTEDEIRVRLAFKKNPSECPDCGGTLFLDGPEGCGSRNIECEQCGSDFNIYPDGLPPITVSRIGWNHSERWLKEGVLKDAAPKD